MLALIATVATATIGSPVNHLTASLISRVGRAESVSICFMPTYHFVRDLVPAVAVFVASIAVIMNLRARAVVHNAP